MTTLTTSAINSKPQPYDLESSTIGWDVTIRDDGDIYGQLDSDDLRGDENWKLIIEEPGKYRQVCE